MNDGHRPHFPPFRYVGAERLSRAVAAAEEGRASRSDKRVLTVAGVALVAPIAIGVVVALVHVAR